MDTNEKVAYSMQLIAQSINKLAESKLDVPAMVMLSIEVKAIAKALTIIADKLRGEKA